MFLAHGVPLSEIKDKLSLREIKLGVGAYLRKEQMLCLQNYENLVMIVSKAFGGSDDGNTRQAPTKKSGNFGDLKAFVADANNF